MHIHIYEPLNKHIREGGKPDNSVRPKLIVIVIVHPIRSKQLTSKLTSN